jgi:hypothetical protein
MEILTLVIFPYLISLAASMRTNAISEKRRKEFQHKIESEATTLETINTRTSLLEQLQLIGTEVARKRGKLGVSKAEEHLFYLLNEVEFQQALARWLTSWDRGEKKAAQKTVSVLIIKALRAGGANEVHLERFKTEYFDLIEKEVFGNVVLANWRLNLALDAAFEKLDQIESQLRTEGVRAHSVILKQHEMTRKLIRALFTRLVEGQTQSFSRQQLKQAVDSYRELVLESCDIIDLGNLPESDRHIAARRIDLRRLYVPLRVHLGSPTDLEDIGNYLKLKVNKGIISTDGLKTRTASEQKPIAVGEAFSKHKRLVILGDPGAGKTTLTRWIATTYLLRLKKDDTYKDMPEVASLPDRDLLPVVIRCRDIDQDNTTKSLDEVLKETFRKAELSDDQGHALQVALRDYLIKGQAVIIIDGLDEITDIAIRRQMGKQIERISIAFPEAPIMVTSRIVGYREMKCPIGREFVHAELADFSKADKDLFAERWSSVTEPPERVEAATKELIKSIHGVDRIERLTGNPMLLTTLALVKRKIGKLPERRVDLYWEAVQVLLNWRAEVDAPIDHREAIPQLEYIAYEMCQRGVQRLREDEIIELLERIRTEYPNIRTIKKNTPEDFLQNLERRTGIIMAVGEVRHNGRTTPVFEFRHLTFQEYLAGSALVEGIFPGRDKKRSIAQNVTALASRLGKKDQSEDDKQESGKSWGEVLRLCLACCNLDDIDDVLLAILGYEPEHGLENIEIRRATLAVFCLSDNPDVSDKVGLLVLEAFVNKFDHGDLLSVSEVHLAATALIHTDWINFFQPKLLKKYRQVTGYDRFVVGNIYASVEEQLIGDLSKNINKLSEKLIKRLKNRDDPDRVLGTAVIILFTIDHIEDVRENLIAKILRPLILMKGAEADTAIEIMGSIAFGTKRKLPEALLQDASQYANEVKEPMAICWTEILEIINKKDISINNIESDCKVIEEILSAKGKNSGDTAAQAEVKATILRRFLIKWAKTIARKNPDKIPLRLTKAAGIKAIKSWLRQVAADTMIITLRHIRRKEERSR